MQRAEVTIAEGRGLGLETRIDDFRWQQHSGGMTHVYALHSAAVRVSTIIEAFPITIIEGFCLLQRGGPLAPTLLVLGLVTFAIFAVATGVWWPFAALAGVWLLWLLYVGINSRAFVFGVAFAAAIMHGSYGLGLLWGLVRGPGPVRRSMGDR